MPLQTAISLADTVSEVIMVCPCILLLRNQPCMHIVHGSLVRDILFVASVNLSGSFLDKLTAATNIMRRSVWTQQQDASAGFVLASFC